MEQRSAQAVLARRLATEHCGGHGCDWYHGLWPALRALDLVASPERNGEFFARALGAQARAGRRRVLITGAADSGMFDVVVAAFEAASERPEITVLDRCETPLLVTAEHALHRGFGPIETWAADIRDAVRPGAFDVICTHGLLPMLEPSDRPPALRRWAELLAPGGVAVTTSSLSTEPAGTPRRFDREAARSFGDQAAAAARLAELPLGVEPDELGLAASRWAEHAVVYSMGSVDDIRQLVSAAGFARVDIEAVEIPGRLTASASGPWAARTSRYAHIVAVR